MHVENEPHQSVRQEDRDDTPKRRGPDFVPVDTPFWVGDRIDSPELHFDEGYVLAVKPVAGGLCNEARRGVGQEYRYDIGDELAFEPGASLVLCEHAVTLRERGQLWRYFHGEELEDEDFYEIRESFILLGALQPVHKRVRADGRETSPWTRMELLEAFKEGRIQSFERYEYDLKAGYLPVVFHHQDIGARIAKLAIKELRHLSEREN